MLSVSAVEAAPSSIPPALAIVGPATVVDRGDRHFVLPLDALAAAPLERWSSNGRPQALSEPPFSLVIDGDYLMGWLDVAESELSDCAGATARAYAALSSLLQRRGYPHLLRSWHYIHDIHRGAGDAERYRQFCVGRHRVVSTRTGFERSLPAATVVGTRVPGMQICFLAGTVPGVQVENPRQTPAFEYPRDYGPASPSFSRATLLKDERLLLMSGTASVVGHATRHPDDVVAQCGEIFVNIEALLARAAEIDGDSPRWNARLLRVFLRHAADLDKVRPRIEARFGREQPAIYLQGDICRQDLAMEIDGVFSAA